MRLSDNRRGNRNKPWHENTKIINNATTSFILLLHHIEPTMPEVATLPAPD